MHMENLCHVLLPRVMRQTVRITLNGANLNKDDMLNAAVQAFQSQKPEFLVGPLGIIENSDDDGSVYECSMVMIPLKLLDHLKDKRVVFYIGIHEDKSKYEICHIPPSLEEVALKDRSGIERPFMTSEYTF